MFILKDDAPIFNKDYFNDYTDQYDAINWIANKEIYPKLPSSVITQINYLPNWAVSKNRFGAPYLTLVDKGLERCNPSVAGYAHYPTLLSSDNATSLDYFSNLETFRDRSYDLVGNRGPGIFGLISLVEWTGGGTDAQNTRQSSITDCRWQVNMHLAYGAKGLWWYNYQIKEKDNDDFGEGMIHHATNQKTPLYDIVKEINRRVLNWGNTLMKLKSSGVYFIKNAGRGKPKGVKEYNYGDISEDFDVYGDGGICVARFDFPWNSDWYYIMVVNMQHGGNKYAQDIFTKKISCKFSERLANRRYVSFNNGKTYELDLGSPSEKGWYTNEFSVKGGDALFFALKKDHAILDKNPSLENIRKAKNIALKDTKESWIYPNPVSDILNINLSNKKYKNYVFYSIDGKVLREQNINKNTNELTINFMNLLKGIYLLKLEGYNSSKTFKVVKN